MSQFRDAIMARVASNMDPTNHLEADAMKIFQAVVTAMQEQQQG